MNMNKDYYANFANRVFDYLNGRINKINPAAGLIIKEFNSIVAVMNFAYITLYLSSIIKDNQTDDDIRMRIIATLSHELSHFDQDIDVKRYADDICYRMDTENQANRYSSEFVCRNYQEMANYCGYFPIDYFRNMNHELSRRSNTYFNHTTVENVYATHLKNLFALDEKGYDIILMDCDGEEFYLKYLNRYNHVKLHDFNKAIMRVVENRMPYNIKSGVSGNNKILKITSVGKIELPNIADTKTFINPVIYHGG